MVHYTDLVGRRLAATRMQRRAVWDTIQMALNGVIFVILGAQLRSTLEGLPQVAAELGLESAWWLAWYVLAITVVLCFLVGVVVRRGLTEVAQHRVSRLHRGAVGAMARQVVVQALQRLALRLHAAVAGREHLQRYFGGGRGRGLAGQGDSHDHGPHRRPVTRV